MPGLVPPVADEREGLVGYLDHQRHVLRIAAYGLTDDQVRATPTSSSLSVGGLIKHCASVERAWMDNVLGRKRERAAVDYEAGFRVEPGETVADLLAFHRHAATETDEIIAGVADLAQPVPVPRDAPWFPKDVEAWSVRWVLLHLIQETARHAGHADIIREAIDGATAFPLMAAAENWPATPWLQPWPPSEA
ncbi:MAG TPA: DinB family protein [Acidimicrobiia bacterium]|nr:DinB family protein [Acidimicrobiia bacterium]